MKIAAILMIFLLFSSLIIVGCADQDQISETSASGPSDEEILAQYPDDLDAALEELEMIE